MRIIETVESLLGGECYMYHTKLIMKAAGVKPAEVASPAPVAAEAATAAAAAAATDDASSVKAREGTSGRFAWHQDYGYWYNNGCLFPNMATVMIAVDRCHKGNGCLQVLTGSHKAGRINHGLVGEQTGADLVRVRELAKACPHEFVELEPGDACFFHCNTLHCSAQVRLAARGGQRCWLWS